MSKYPECEKMEKTKDKSQLCGEFLDYLQSKYYMMEKTEPHDDMYVPIGYSSYINVKKVLAEFFEIDLEEVEKEKRQIFEELRSK